jgi:uncharacterized protein (DUF433 family)
LTLLRAPGLSEVQHPDLRVRAADQGDGDRREKTARLIATAVSQTVARRARELPEETNMAVREPLITTSPGRLSGTPVFAGTRVPVQTLIDYLEAGDSLDAFLDDFPSVSREHAIAVLEVAKSALLAEAVAA